MKPDKVDAGWTKRPSQEANHDQEDAQVTVQDLFIKVHISKLLCSGCCQQSGDHPSFIQEKAEVSEEAIRKEIETRHFREHNRG